MPTRIARQAPTRLAPAIAVLLSGASCGDNSQSGGGGAGGVGGVAGGGGGLVSAGGSGGVSTGGGGGGEVIDAGIISSSSASKDEFETSLSVGPDGTIVVSWTEEALNGPFPIGYAFSTDGGDSWLAPKKVFPAVGSGADSVVGHGDDGSSYLVWLGHTSTSSAIYAARAEPGVVQFGDPVEVTDAASNGSYDKPWMTRLASGDVLVTYQEIALDGSIAGIAASTSDGVGFTKVDIARGPQFRNLFYPCVADTGRVWVTFYVDGRIGLRHSDDDGATWSASDVIVSDPTESDVAFAEPECAARGDDVWIVYGLSHDPDSEATGSDPKLYSIRLAHASGDAAVDVRIDAHDAEAAAFFMKPQLLVEDGGTLDLTYYAGNDDGDVNGSFRLARSTDGGATIETSSVLHGPTVFVQSRASTQWMGDYSGLAAVGGEVYASYADNASGNAHIAFLRKP